MQQQALCLTAPALRTALPATWLSCLSPLPPGYSSWETQTHSPLLQLQAASAAEPSSPLGSGPAPHPSDAGYLQQVSSV